MPRFKLSKLVRDKIVDHQIKSGAKPSFRKLDPLEHKQELINKIIEEAQEILHSDSGQVAAEIADVQQALDDLKELCGLTDDEIMAAQKEKNDKNGAFKQGYFIDHIEIDEKDKWTAYYRENADRYPEVMP
ncbi:MAG TPA: nucleoside triphosphate pyrophosphohydrolase [Candidatus Saccharimonadales bacterium]